MMRRSRLRRWTLRKITARMRRRLLTRHADRASYESAYAAALEATLDILIQGRIPDDLSRLAPIDLTLPDEAARFLRPAGRVFREDLQDLVRDQRNTADAGVWESYITFLALQPALYARLSKHVHDYAARHTLMRPDRPVQPFTVGPASVMGLVLVNHMLCLHRLMHTRPRRASRLHPLTSIRYGVRLSQLRRLAQEGFRCFKAMQPQREAGDLIFYASLVPVLERMRADTPPVPYVNRLARFSPLTMVGRLDAPHLWGPDARSRLSGIERLLDDGSMYTFMERTVQAWVDALESARNDELYRRLERLETILSYLLPGIAPHTPCGQTLDPL